jgi:hypothetical protein
MTLFLINIHIYKHTYILVKRVSRMNTWDISAIPPGINREWIECMYTQVPIILKLSRVPDQVPTRSKIFPFTCSCNEHHVPTSAYFAIQLE